MANLILQVPGISTQVLSPLHSDFPLNCLNRSLLLNVTCDYHPYIFQDLFYLVFKDEDITMMLAYGLIINNIWNLPPPCR